jgi:hypothetical protein
MFGECWRSDRFQSSEGKCGRHQIRYDLTEFEMLFLRAIGKKKK